MNNPKIGDTIVCENGFRYECVTRELLQDKGYTPPEESTIFGFRERGEDTPGWTSWEYLTDCYTNGFEIVDVIPCDVISDQINMEDAFQTQDGRPVRILAVDLEGTQCVAAVILSGEFSHAYLTTATGQAAYGPCSIVRVPQTDWSKVAIDTPIFVRDVASDEWQARHFAGLWDGTSGTYIQAFYSGRTSHSQGDFAKDPWKYGKLAK